MARARLRVLAACAAVAGCAGLVLSSCGVPTQTHPVDLASSDLPNGLIGAGTTTTTEAGPKVPLALVQIWLVSGGRLVPVGRSIPSPPTLSGALGSLLAGPTAKDAAAGLHSDISAGSTVLDTRLGRDKAMATVDLSPDFADIGGSQQILAVAQIVYTATSLPGVGSVSFELGGNPVSVPVADGELKDGPVTRGDFAPLVGQQGS